jgi:chromosome segregation ATPase
LTTIETEITQIKVISENEREVLNGRIFTLEGEKRELENKCNMLSKENSELKLQNNKFNGQVFELETNVKNLTRKIEQFNIESENLQKTKVQLQTEMDLKLVEIRRIQEDHQGLKGKLQMSNVEMQRLENEKSELERGLRLQKEEMLKFQMENKQQLEELRKQLERQQLESVQLRQKEFDLKLNDYKRDYESQIRLLKGKVIEFEKQGVFFKKEKEYLEQKNTEIRGDLEKTKFQLTTLQEDYEQEIQELEERVKTYKCTYVNPKDYEIKFRAEKSKLETDLMQERAKVRELEMSIQNLQAENRRLGQLTNKRLREMEEFKRKLGEHGSLDSLDELKKRLKLSEREVDDLQEKIMKIKGEKNAMLSNITHLKSEVETLRSDNYDLEEMIKRKKNQIKEIESELMKYKKSYSQLYSERHKSEGDRMVGQEKINALKLNLQR